MKLFSGRKNLLGSIAASSKEIFKWHNQEPGLSLKETISFSISLTVAAFSNSGSCPHLFLKSRYSQVPHPLCITACL
jgi:hypothetical protein